MSNAWITFCLISVIFQKQNKPSEWAIYTLVFVKENRAKLGGNRPAWIEVKSHYLGEFGVCFV